MRGPYFEADWRREQLRTNLWLVPVVQTLGIVVLFGVTYTIEVTNPRGRSKGVKSLVVDGSRIAGNLVPLATDGRSAVRVAATLGA